MYPWHVQALTLKGKILEGMMNYKVASDTYRRALTFDPNNTELKEGLKRMKEKQSEHYVVKSTTNNRTQTVSEKTKGCVPP